MIKVYTNILNKNEKDFFNNVVLKNKLPYFIQNGQTLEDDRIYLSHLLQHRETGAIASNIYYDVMNIIKRLCKKTNIKINRSLRACINLTFPYNPGMGVIHVDHTFPHKQFIIYLTDGGATHFFDKNKKLIKKVNSKKFKVLFFDKEFHAVVHPKKGIRILVVVTFV
jgi:hypothetical protein|tara:strand:- start:22 stop:522 length:501 start_codon:yes stop_codon:yes gene_type:complete